MDFIMVNDIIFDERYDDMENETTTLYYVAPKKYLDNFFPENTYPEAVSCEISIEVTTNNIEAKEAKVSISPTKKVDSGFSDYDWTDIDLPYEVIETLFVIADV